MDPTRSTATPSTFLYYSYLRNAWEHLMRYNRQQREAHLAWILRKSGRWGKAQFFGRQQLGLGDYLLRMLLKSICL